MRHKITSYRRDELYTSYKEYSTTANDDEEAAQSVRTLRAQGYTISSWLQECEQDKDTTQQRGKRR